jgi:Xaa-Pro aminopeptidase
MKSGQTLGFDGRLLSAKLGRKLAEELAENDVKIAFNEDLLAKQWKNRPSLPCNPIWELPLDWSGQSSEEKLQAVRDKLAKDHYDSLVLNSLDDIMWLFNIRGSDIPHNPVAFAYAVIEQERAVLFVQEVVIGTRWDTMRCTSATLDIVPYEEFYSWIDNWEVQPQHKIMLDNDKCNYYIYKMLADKAKIKLGTSPTTALKAIKNATEQKHLRETYKKDSAAVIKFLKWLGEQEETISELEAADRIAEFRREQPGFIDLSFETIAAYGANAAMMHYQATAESHALIEKKGLFLIDSGGQYYGGTTDVTRTVVMGAITAEMRRHFTATAQGLLHLMNLTFLHGSTGRNLDIIARQPSWQLLSDYKSGTGHGIGYMLNVHEGPQGIWNTYRKENSEAILEAGMLVTNEPGAYKAGEYGIRHENVMLIKEVAKNDEGTFLAFETLTLVPLDLAGIDPEQLAPQDIEQLNAYHRHVYEEMRPYLTEDEGTWLKEATRML